MFDCSRSWNRSDATEPITFCHVTLKPSQSAERFRTYTPLSRKKLGLFPRYDDDCDDDYYYLTCEAPHGGWFGYYRALPEWWNLPDYTVATTHSLVPLLLSPHLAPSLRFSQHVLSSAPPAFVDSRHSVSYQRNQPSTATFGRQTGWNWLTQRKATEEKEILKMRGREEES